MADTAFRDLVPVRICPHHFTVCPPIHDAAAIPAAFGDLGTLEAPLGLGLGASAPASAGSPSPLGCFTCFRFAIFSESLPLALCSNNNCLVQCLMFSYFGLFL